MIIFYNMNRSIFSNLYYKVFQSGNVLYLFLGLNVIVFLTINIFAMAEFLFSGQTVAADWLTRQFAMPGSFEELPWKFWTIITYMFSHRAFFHLLFNMLWLYWLGMIFLDFLNKRQFIFTYLAGGIMGAVFYLLAFNFIPVFASSGMRLPLIGASASVMAIVVATATMVPDFTIRLLFFGNVKLKYLALAYFVLDVIGIGSGGAGGSIAHIGGAVLGFVYINQLKRGNDWSKILVRKGTLRVVRNPKPAGKPSGTPDQEAIDRILDKISQSGYDNLTRSEKEQLFKASKNR